MANKYRAWTDGEVLTAANLIDFVQKQVLIVCDSSADYPDSSTRREGMAVYDKDSDKLLTYTTSSTGWVPPWNMPWGYVTSASITANSSTFTTVADVTGLSVSPTVVANRRLKVTFYGLLDSTVTTDSIASYITDGSNNQLNQGYYAGIGGGAMHHVVAYVTTTAGTPTYKVRGARITGTGNGKIGASSTVPATLTVEDIGPNGAPA